MCECRTHIPEVFIVTSVKSTKQRGVMLKLK